jgi:hypothetical protein
LTLTVDDLACSSKLPLHHTSLHSTRLDPTARHAIPYPARQQPLIRPPARARLPTGWQAAGRSEARDCDGLDWAVLDWDVQHLLTRVPSSPAGSRPVEASGRGARSPRPMRRCICVCMRMRRLLSRRLSPPCRPGDGPATLPPPAAKSKQEPTQRGGMRGSQSGLWRWLQQWQ